MVLFRYGSKCRLGPEVAGGNRFMMLSLFKYQNFAILYKPTIQVRQLQQDRHVLRLDNQTRSAYPIRRRCLRRSIDIDWDMPDIVCTATSVTATLCALRSPLAVPLTRRILRRSRCPQGRTAPTSSPKDASRCPGTKTRRDGTICSTPPDLFALRPRDRLGSSCSTKRSADRTSTQRIRMMREKTERCSHP